MIKQRFVVYKAIGKDGIVSRHLRVVGGRAVPFLGPPSGAWWIGRTTESLMNHIAFASVDCWKLYAKGMGACRFQKVIYFN